MVPKYARFKEWLKKGAGQGYTSIEGH